MSRSGDPAALRAALVAQLRERGELADPRVAAAVSQVPRHVFARRSGCSARLATLGYADVGRGCPAC